MHCAHSHAADQVCHCCAQSHTVNSREDFIKACVNLKVNMDSAAVEELFQVCEIAEGDSLGLREFLVVLAVARVINAMPEQAAKSKLQSPHRRYSY
jgi:hypothetical protein